MRRLSVVDEIFLRTHRGLGAPIALQGLWRAASAVQPPELGPLYDALRAGPLGRRVVAARIPGARARWQHSNRAYPLDYRPATLTPAEILLWADARGRDLDPEHGPGWRLSAAPLDDGSTLVALTCSHVLADARGLIIAAEQAVRQADSERAGPSRPGFAIDPESGPAPDSDWVDAARVWATVLLGGAHAAGRRIRWSGRSREKEKAGRTDSSGPRGSRETERGADAPQRPLPAPAVSPSGGAAPAAGPAEAMNCAVSASGAPPPDGELSEPAMVLRCPAQEWERIAAGYGGTANSLFIWFVANMLWANGFPGPNIAASLPVDTRSESRIDNDLAVTEITVTRPDGPAEIRAKARKAYERRMTSPGGLPEEFLYLVPDKVALFLSRGAGERDILCSNIGVIPPALYALGSHDCTGIATRAVHPGLTHARRPRTRLSGYLCRFRDDYILTLASLDPERVSDTAELHRLATETATRIGLPIGPW